MLEYLEFAGGSGSALVALLVAKLIYNKWFAGKGDGETRRLLEERFSQQHDDLKAIKDVAYAVRDIAQWLKDAHDRRNADGAFVWWNKESIERKIEEIDGEVGAVIAMLEARQTDAQQAKTDILNAIDRAERRSGGG
jgi:hypothetical protein